jgi:hypothetical protein
MKKTVLTALALATFATSAAFAAPVKHDTSAHAHKAMKTEKASTSTAQSGKATKAAGKTY